MTREAENETLQRYASIMLEENEARMPEVLGRLREYKAFKELCGSGLVLWTNGLDPAQYRKLDDLVQGKIEAARRFSSKHDEELTPSYYDALYDEENYSLVTSKEKQVILMGRMVHIISHLARRHQFSGTYRGGQLYQSLSDLERLEVINMVRRELEKLGFISESHPLSMVLGPWWPQSEALCSNIKSEWCFFWALRITDLESLVRLVSYGLETGASIERLEKFPRLDTRPESINKKG